MDTTEIIHKYNIIADAYNEVIDRLERCPSMGCALADNWSYGILWWDVPGYAPKCNEENLKPDHLSNPGLITPNIITPDNPLGLVDLSYKLVKYVDNITPRRGGPLNSFVPHEYIQLYTMDTDQPADIGISGTGGAWPYCSTGINSSVDMTNKKDLRLLKPASKHMVANVLDDYISKINSLKSQPQFATTFSYAFSYEIAIKEKDLSASPQTLAAAKATASGLYSQALSKITTQLNYYKNNPEELFVIDNTSQGAIHYFVYEDTRDFTVQMWSNPGFENLVGTSYIIYTDRTVPTITYSGNYNSSDDSIEVTKINFFSVTGRTYLVFCPYESDLTLYYLSHATTNTPTSACTLNVIINGQQVPQTTDEDLLDENGDSFDETNYLTNSNYHPVISQPSEEAITISSCEAQFIPEGFPYTTCCHGYVYCSNRSSRPYFYNSNGNWYDSITLGLLKTGYMIDYEPVVISSS